MAQNASPELAPVFQNDPTSLVAGNLDASRVADMTRKVRRFLSRHANDDDALSTTWDASDDPRAFGSESRMMVTGTSDVFDLEQREVVHVSDAGVNEDDEELVRVTFPTRDAGPEDAYSYETTASNLLLRMDADGGWTEVRAFEVLSSTVSCPVCGAFVSVDEDGYGLPAAECSRVSCHGFLDARDLIDSGAVENVY